jgi:hypothetical protein
MRMPKIIGWFITFNFINIAWVFFRANSFHDAAKVLRGMFLGTFVYPAQLPFSQIVHDWGAIVGKWSKPFLHEPWIGYWLLAGFMIVLFLPNSMQMKERFRTNGWYLFLTVCLMLSVFFLYRKSEFIYFNF